MASKFNYLSIRGGANSSAKESNKWIFDYLIFIIIALFILIPLSIRAPLQISDGDSYVAHAMMDIDIRDSRFYFYPLYWCLAWVGGLIGALQFPGMLSSLVSLLIIGASAGLSRSARYIFLILILLVPSSFNTEYVALRNGVALGMILLGLARSSNIWLVSPLFIHPGVLPITASILFLKYSNFSWKSFSIIIGLIGAILYVSGGLLEDLISVRGYEGVEGANELWFVYIMYALLALFYWMALRRTQYRWFLPIMVLLWFIVGAEYSFAWRLFVQVLPISAFILLKYADRESPYRFVFLCQSLLFGLYSATKWHPFTEYSDGWWGYWMSFF